MARTTRYVYDALGRQVQTIFPEVQVYDASRDEIHDPSRFNLETAGDVYDGGLWFGEVRTETIQQLSSRVVYNAFGEAVANIDVSGYVSAKAYDKTGRVVYDVDALGYVTHQARNTFGDVTALTRHAQAAEPATTQGMWAGTVLSSADDRTVTTEYDHLGRAVQVTQPAVWVSSGSSLGYEASPITRTRYNAFGQVIQVAELADATTDRWATTTHYHDRRGDEIATIDALGYLTTRQYDAAGNVVDLTEHADPAAAWSIDGYEPPPASADDRRTVYTYDLANRITAQTR